MDDLEIAQPRKVETAGPVREFLVFGLGRELYATPIAHVRKIVAPLPITPVPRAPVAVLGVCSVRGELATVYDLRTCLGLDTKPSSFRFRVLLVESVWGEIIGFHVDEVHQVARLTPDQIESPQDSLGADARDYWLGVSRAQGPAIVLIDLTQLAAERRG